MLKDDSNYNTDIKFCGNKQCRWRWNCHSSLCWTGLSQVHWSLSLSGGEEQGEEHRERQDNRKNYSCEVAFELEITATLIMPLLHPYSSLPRAASTGAGLVGFPDSMMQACSEASELLVNTHSLVSQNGCGDLLRIITKQQMWRGT